MNLKKSITDSEKNKTKAAQLFSTWIINQHIRMISEGSCTEDWSNDAENSALRHRNTLYFKVYYNR